MTRFLRYLNSLTLSAHGETRFHLTSPLKTSEPTHLRIVMEHICHEMNFKVHSTKIKFVFSRDLKIFLPSTWRDQETEEMGER